MTIVTTISMESGDRAALSSFLDDLLERARRKGVELKGPRSPPPTEHRASLYERLDGDSTRRLGEWTYSVYRREVEVVGHEGFARRIIDEGFPDSVHAEAEFSRVTPPGG